ncbi:hypothetical protein Tco_0721968 [Tanacetum coccineum]
MLRFISTSRCVPCLGEVRIFMCSKKQTYITVSTIESDFVTLALAGKEAEWLRYMIHGDVQYGQTNNTNIIRCDSAPTMAKAYSQIYNGKSRHLDTQFPSKQTVRTEFNVESSHLEIGTHVFIFPRSKIKRITCVNIEVFADFNKLGPCLPVEFINGIGTHALIVSSKTNIMSVV